MWKKSFTGVRATSDPHGLHELGHPRNTFFLLEAEVPDGLFSDAFSGRDCIVAPPGRELSDSVGPTRAKRSHTQVVAGAAREQTSGSHCVKPRQGTE